MQLAIIGGFFFSCHIYCGRPDNLNLPVTVESELWPVSVYTLEELFYLDKRQQLLPPVNVAVESHSPEEKMTTSLSVAHLALAVKLLVDSNVISNKNSSELMTIVARNFKTSRNEEISENSLRNKYYSPESGSLKYMREVLLMLSKLLRQFGG